MQEPAMVLKLCETINARVRVVGAYRHCHEVSAHLGVHGYLLWRNATTNTQADCIRACGVVAETYVG